MNIKVIYNSDAMETKAGKVYWMPSGLAKATDAVDPEHTFMPHKIDYQGHDVSKIRIQPCFNGKSRLPFSKVTLLEPCKIDGHYDYTPFKSAYLCASKVRELRELLRSSPWGSNNPGGVTRTHDFYERWLYDILHTLPGA